MEPAAGLAHLRAAVADVREVLATGDLDARVPACPEWSLRQLGWHLGQIHRWVCGSILAGRSAAGAPPGPADRPGLLAWYDEGAGALLDLLAGTDPDTPCWTFGPHPRTARFWFRRQAHEHAVHVLDAHASQGEQAALDPVLALDGVDEVVDMFFPRQVRLGRIAPLTRSLAVQAEGQAVAGAREACWVLASDGTGPAPVPEATVTGPADALDLLLWGRIGLDDARLRLDGDPEAARAVLATAIVP